MPARLRALLLTDPAIVLLTIVMGTLSLGASLVDAKGHVQHGIARAWSRMLLWVSGVRVRVEGLEKLDPHASYVLVANHLSLIDTPLVLGHIPLQFRFFAKQGLFKIPFLGWHLRRAGHLPVVRENPRASLKSLTNGAHLLRSRGISALLFPEGGRAPAGLRDFKDGAAYLAIKAGVPIVPIGIAGTREILAMGSIVVRPGRAVLRIGDPIPSAGVKLDQRTRLTDELREKVAELMSPQPESVRPS